MKESLWCRDQHPTKGNPPTAKSHHTPISLLPLRLILELPRSPLQPVGDAWRYLCISNQYFKSLFIKVGCVTSVGFRGTTANLTTGRLVFGSDVATWENRIKPWLTQFDHTDGNMWGGGGCQLVVQWYTYQDQLAIGKLKTVSHLSPDKPSAGNCQIILLNCKFLVFITILQILESEIRKSKYWISNSTSRWPGLQFSFKFEIWLIFLLPIFNYLSGVPEYMAEKSGTKSSLVSPVATQEE